jgi:serine/threonine protein kinase
MENPSRAPAFRQEFRDAMSVRHANVTATLEVMPIAGRPAAVQEWVEGQLSTDWGALAAVPGVWFRLVRQAALGLQAIHQAGFVHGHLQAESILLTADGVLKVGGFGEPSWLVEGAASQQAEMDVTVDLAALGRIAASWAASAPRRKGAKGRPIPASVQKILKGLGCYGHDPSYAEAAVLLEELDRLSGEQPTNPEAWDRLLHQVRDQAAASLLRQSA